MAIDALPPELLCLILEFAVQDSAYSTRWAFLRSTALLSSAWCGPSQATLWASLKIAKQETGRKWLASHASKGEVYATYCLDLTGVYGVEGLSAQTATKILGRCIGTKTLRLTDFGRLSARVLESDSLRGLQSLTIATRIPDTPSLISSLRFPFRLRRLSLYDRSYSPALVSSLFACSFTTLTTLSLSLNPSSKAYSGLVASFPLVAASLRELNLNHTPTPALIAQLKGCTTLKILDCGHSAGDLGAILDSIPAALDSLRIRLDYNLLDAIVILGKRLEIYDEATRKPNGSSLRQLRKLEIMGIRKVSFERDETGREFLRLCRQRGVELWLGDGWIGVGDAESPGL